MNNNKTYWLHRISGGKNAWSLAHSLLNEMNLLSIGWKDFSSEQFVKEVKEQKMARIEKEYRQRGSELPKNRHNLYRFIVGMKDGDIVVVPGWKSFRIYRIVGDDVLSTERIDQEFLSKKGYTMEGGHIKNTDGGDVDLGFFRKVEPVTAEAARDKFAMQGLSSRMKIRQTNAKLDKTLEKEVDEAIRNINSNRSINIKNAIIENAEKVVFEQIQHIADCDKFEKLVEWYLESIGAKVVKTPSKNSSPTEDGDADKVAYFDTLRLVILVQVKKHKGETNSWAVEQITSYRQNYEEPDGYTSLLWVISSAEGYSENAIRTAKENNVRLIDGHEFAAMIVENGVYDLPL